jgi:hypothetical protein
MDTITTTLKRQWFAEIVERKKKIEYREIKPYWTVRLKRVKTPFRLVLRNACYRMYQRPEAGRRAGAAASDATAVTDAATQLLIKAGIHNTVSVTVRKMR